MAYLGLPVYKALVDEEDTFMLCISLVDEPATESMWQKFGKDSKVERFSIENDEKRIVRGLVMAANLPIYRVRDGFEYYIVYDADTIRKMAEKYLKMGFQNKVDTQHNNIFEDGVNMVQFFIKDVDAGINPKGFEPYEDGSLFVEFHVENDDVWDAIKNGVFKGFSLEGIFDVVYSEEQFNNIDKDEQEIFDLIAKIENKIKQRK